MLNICFAFLLLDALNLPCPQQQSNKAGQHYECGFHIGWWDKNKRLKVSGSTPRLYHQENQGL